MSLSQFWFQVTENCYEKNPLLWSLIIASTQQTKEITKKSFTAKLAKKLRAKIFQVEKVAYLEDCLFLLGCGPLQLLLDKPWAMLVLAELNNMVGQLTQLQVRVPAVPKIRCILQGRSNYLS